MYKDVKNLKQWQIDWVVRLELLKKKLIDLNK